MESRNKPGSRRPRLLHIAVMVVIGISLLSAKPGWREIYDKKPKFAKGWKYIVIHHSATASGNNSSFHEYHTKMGYGGMTYHFVICNGKGGTDGLVEEGFRWKEQKIGTHVFTDAWYYNIFGIGICLVGDLNALPPTERQMASLVRLTVRLMHEYGIPPENIIGHKDVIANDIDWDSKKISVVFHPGNTAKTSCPGKLFPMERFRRLVTASTQKRDVSNGTWMPRPTNSSGPARPFP